MCIYAFVYGSFVNTRSFDLATFICNLKHIFLHQKVQAGKVIFSRMFSTNGRFSNQNRLIFVTKLTAVLDEMDGIIMPSMLRQINTSDIHTTKFLPCVGIEKIII